MPDRCSRPTSRPSTESTWPPRYASGARTRDRRTDLGDGVVAYGLDDDQATLTVTTTQEGGRTVLCDPRPVASFELDPELREATVDQGPTSTEPHALLPDDVGDGLQLVQDGSVEPRHGAQSVLDRVWQAGPFGGVRVNVGTYARVQDAAEAATSIATEMGPGAIDLRALEVHPDVRSARYLGWEWLMVQTPSVPAYVDRAVVQLGSLVVTVQVSGLEPERQDDVLEHVVGAVLERAGVTA